MLPSSMPVNVWYIVVVGAIVLVALALWLGRGLRIRKGAIIVDPARADATKSISVGAGAKITRSTTGDISGISVSGSGPVPAAGKASVDVLRGGDVRDARVGDISGIRQTDDKGPQP
jgi:hypothetical protein